MLTLPPIRENSPAYEPSNWPIDSSCLMVFELDITCEDFGLISLHNHVSQFHIIHAFILVLFLWRMLTNTRNLNLGGPNL